MLTVTHQMKKKKKDGKQERNENSLNLVSFRSSNIFTFAAEHLSCIWYPLKEVSIARFCLCHTFLFV